MQPVQDVSELWDKIGSEQLFEQLVDRFYEGVEQDPPLRALYPESLTAGKSRLTWFLVQRFGGPQLFNQRRGAAKLRMRHAEFAITRDVAGRWHGHMMAAVDSIEAFAPYREAISKYFEDAAMFLINSGHDTHGGCPVPVA